MIGKFFSFFKKLVGSQQIEDYGNPSYSDVVNSPARHIQDTIKKMEKKSSTSVSKNISTPKTKTVINRSVLMRKIKTNIFFLEELLIKLEGVRKYRSYYLKLKDMKNQSEGSFKIIHRMSEEAPYYQNTLKAILAHTRTIESLFKENKK